MAREVFAGPNFSGRSAALLARLRGLGRPAFFVGPYAEAALSGLSTSVADELALYRAPQSTRPAFAALATEPLLRRVPQSLSGGEQVLLALRCFSQAASTAIGVDTALEQLDGDNRAAALAYLSGGGFDAMLIDNRAEPEGWTVTACAESPAFAIDWDALAATVRIPPAQAIAIEALDFAYRHGKTIFANAGAVLTPGAAYRLFGANGAGKTTLLKLLAGALRPSRGRLLLDGATCLPWRDGNRAFALATQNPDHQWCGATLREDIARRRRALGGAAAAALDDGHVEALARALGIASPDQHLYELPLAARKRLSWLWPLAGAMPWIVFDEPTVGQDRATRGRLAGLLARLCAAGAGVLFVTHDDAFAAALPHRVLRIENRTISLL